MLRKGKLPKRKMKLRPSRRPSRQTARRPILRGRRGLIRKRPTRRLTTATVLTVNKEASIGALEAGKVAARTNPYPGDTGRGLGGWIHKCWNSWIEQQQVSVHPWTRGVELAKRFAQGFCEEAGLAVPNYAWMPCTKSISVVLTAMNEALSLTSVLEQLERLPVDEIIIIVNGSTDGSFELARMKSNAIIVHYTDALGHDVGRSIGAKLARSEIVLFLDSDFTVSAEQLVLFAAAIEGGIDVALNNITPYLGHFGQRDSVTMMKELLNRAMGRRDLEANSLTAVPHALSRNAIDQIGYANLLVPPKAQAIAISKGLKVSCPVSVDVISKNKVRNSNTGSHNRVADLIIGDHLEALSMLMTEKGDRLGEPDRIRNRSLIRGGRV